MHVAQSGIFALGTGSHSYLEFDLHARGDPLTLVQVIASLGEPGMTTGGVNLVVGFRPSLWAGVAWEAVGCARGAYELALTYAQEREQFGRPIGRFQLVQDLLVRMLSNITASACLVTRLSQMQDAGIMKDEHASLAKAFCTVPMRETVGYARELLAGNGLLIAHHVGRFVADAEAIYSYEGTREMNTLIVGKA